MIKKLTKQQEEQLIEFRNKYLKIGLSTNPINKKEIPEVIKSIYKDYLDLDIVI